MLATRVLDTSIGLVAVDLVDGHVHEITVAGEHGLEQLGPAVFEGGFDRSEEALVAALVRAGLPESEARSAATDVWTDWSGPATSPTRMLPYAASALAPTFLLLALFGLAFLGLGALIWYFLANAL
jgi:hypothetical protein